MCQTVTALEETPGYIDSQLLSDKMTIFYAVRGSFVIGHQYCTLHTETIHTLISSFQCLQTFIREVGGVLREVGGVLREVGGVLIRPM